MRWWIVVVSYALCMIYSVNCSKATVSIEDIWGTLSLQAGETTNMRFRGCININTELTWFMLNAVTQLLKVLF